MKTPKKTTITKINNYYNNIKEENLLNKLGSINNQVYYYNTANNNNNNRKVAFKDNFHKNKKQNMFDLDNNTEYNKESKQNSNKIYNHLYNNRNAYSDTKLINNYNNSINKINNTIKSATKLFTTINLVEKNTLGIKLSFYQYNINEKNLNTKNNSNNKLLDVFKIQNSNNKNDFKIKTKLDFSNKTNSDKNLSPLSFSSNLSNFNNNNSKFKINDYIIDASNNLNDNICSNINFKLFPTNKENNKKVYDLNTNLINKFESNSKYNNYNSKKEYINNTEELFNINDIQNLKKNILIIKNYINLINCEYYHISNSDLIIKTINNILDTFDNAKILNNNNLYLNKINNLLFELNSIFESKFKTLSILCDYKNIKILNKTFCEFTENYRSEIYDKYNIKYFDKIYEVFSLVVNDINKLFTFKYSKSLFNKNILDFDNQLELNYILKEYNKLILLDTYKDFELDFVFLIFDNIYCNIFNNANYSNVSKKKYKNLLSIKHLTKLKNKLKNDKLCSLKTNLYNNNITVLKEHNYTGFSNIKETIKIKKCNFSDFIKDIINLRIYNNYNQLKLNNKFNNKDDNCTLLSQYSLFQLIHIVILLTLILLLWTIILIITVYKHIYNNIN